MAAIVAPMSMVSHFSPLDNDTLLAPTMPLDEGPLPSTSPSPSPYEILMQSAPPYKEEPFDPAQHLAYHPPSKIFSMAELGLEGKGISDTAVSDPFPLFSQECISQMRAEVFRPEVINRFKMTSAFTAYQVRGYCPKYGKFIYDAWHHPQTLAIISQIAGIDLIPALDYDVGHINISMGNSSATKSSSSEAQEDETAFDWHFDCYPFVVVTMLSDCDGMIGGETMLRTGTGGTMKVRGPSKGTAVVMQGKYLEHQALKARGGRERISMVTSFRPRCPLVKDESILAGVRGISHVPTLYNQYSGYRLENLEERVRDQLRKMRRRSQAGVDFNGEELKVWLREQKTYIETVIVELDGGASS